MTIRKTHDADFCERIRELEKRIEELERRPAPYWVQPYWPYPYTPWWVNTSPTITYGLTTTNVVTADTGIQSTFTGIVS